MLRRYIIIVSLVVVGVVLATAPGCSCTKKHAQQPAPPGVVSYAPTMPDQVTRTEPAPAELKQAMLALKRVHFAFDSAKLLPGSGDVIAIAAAHLAELPEVRLYVAGHCDERGSIGYNRVLGEKRAKAVARELIRLGVPADRLTIVSHGKERPVVVGNDEMSHARNRRVEFEVLRGDVRLVIEEGSLYNDRGRPLDS
jgi:peptidoglycan-associated lipoprotein